MHKDEFKNFIEINCYEIILNPNEQGSFLRNYSNNNISTYNWNEKIQFI